MKDSKYVDGLADTLKALSRYGSFVEKEIGQVVEANAREMEYVAKRLAPYNLGKLRQSIRALRVSNKEWQTLANTTGLAPYAPYMEFGTGGLVRIPPGWGELAAAFKGKGIRQVNIRPRPFMYPAFTRQMTIFIQDMQDLLKRAERVFGTR